MDPDASEHHERVKKLRVEQYVHTEAGLTLRLKNMVIYLLNEDDFGIDPASFQPERHEHAIPKYEMARIYLLVCALTQDDLGFRPEDRGDPVYRIYEKAYQRCYQWEEDPAVRAKLDALAHTCGFQRPVGDLGDG